MKFSGKVGNGPVNKRLNFGGDPIHEFVFATLARRALAEVCTVLVLLVFSVLHRHTAKSINSHEPYVGSGLSFCSKHPFYYL